MDHSPTPFSSSSQDSIATRIPYEILSVIFTYCLPDKPKEAIQPSPCCAPLLLCHVCSNWRRIALNVSGLWQKAHFVLKVAGAARLREVLTTGIHRRSIESLCWWIGNAKAVPMSIRLTCKRKLETTPIAPYQTPAETLDVIARALSTAKYLDMDRLSAAAFANHSLHCEHHLLLADFPNLATLLIRDMPYEYRLPPSAHLSTSLAVVVPQRLRQPVLRGLFLERFNVYQPDVHQTLCWDQIERICLTEVTIQKATWFLLIRQFQQLKNGHFDLHLDLNDDGGPSPPTTTLSNLRLLHLRWNGGIGPYQPRLLENLTLPALNYLRIDAHVTIPALNKLLRWTPNIDSLHLGSNTPWNPSSHGEVMRFRRHDDQRPLSHFVPRLSNLLLSFDITGIDQLQDGHNDAMQSIVNSPWLDLRGLINLKQLEFDCKGISDSDRDILEQKIRRLRMANNVEVILRKPDAPPLWGFPSSIRTI